MASALQGRLEVRLADLSHAQLVALLAEACASNDAIRNKADALLAVAKPVPGWAVQGVLTSTDLTLPLLHGHACAARLACRIALVCKAWAHAWSRLLSEGS